MNDKKGKIGPVGPEGARGQIPGVRFDSERWTDEHGELQELCKQVQSFLKQHPWIASIVEISKGAIASSRSYELKCSCDCPTGSPGIDWATPGNHEEIVIARISFKECGNPNWDSVLKIIHLNDNFVKSFRFRVDTSALEIEVYAYKDEMMFSIGCPDKS